MDTHKKDVCVEIWVQDESDEGEERGIKVGRESGITFVFVTINFLFDFTVALKKKAWFFFLLLLIRLKDRRRKASPFSNFTSCTSQTVALFAWNSKGTYATRFHYQVEDLEMSEDCLRRNSTSIGRDNKHVDIKMVIVWAILHHHPSPVPRLRIHYNGSRGNKTHTSHDNRWPGMFQMPGTQ